jgi:uncharacterized protein YacL (UPF0231 family)
MKKVLKDLKPENENYSFSFNGDFEDFGIRLTPPTPPAEPVAVLASPGPAPAAHPAPVIALVPPAPPKKPLEYLKTLDLPTNTLYLIDGKKHPGKSGKAALAKLKNENINSVQIYHAGAAQEQFGNEGKEGVVVVKTGKSDPDNFLLQEFGEDRANREVIRREFHNDIRQEEHDIRMREHELRMKEHEEQTRERIKENEERAKEHAIRMQEHEVRVRENEIRAKEAEKRAAQFEKIKQELVKDKLINTNDKKLSIQINQEGFTVNGVKQPAAIYDKYKKLFYPDRTDWSGSFSETINITED